jgi:hypothetical protein
VPTQRGFREPRGVAQALWGPRRQEEHLQFAARARRWRTAGDTGREAGWKAAAALRGNMEEDRAAETAWDIAAEQRELEEHADSRDTEEWDVD